MIDAAHRFIPLATIKTIIDGMLFSKMNVLNFHFSDNAAARVVSTKFPEITAALGSEVYTEEHIKNIVSYAADRGIMVVPEVLGPCTRGTMQFMRDYVIRK
jgi:hexosaminidase